jgi:hypothetical protein
VSGTPEQRRAYYEANRELIKERSRAWYAANRERAAQQKRTYRLANLEKIRADGRAWNAANRERVSAKNRARRLSDPAGAWASTLKKNHGMTPEQWSAMWDQQRGLCYLCEEPLSDNRSRTVIDHDHSHCGPARSCGYCRRGLACSNCNTAIGLLGDDIAKMRTVVANFERTQAQAQALMATAPVQPDLFGPGDAVA